MARPQKQTVDYFPHSVEDSKTKFILENSYGNDGYAFWFKLLELLCKSDGHYYDCNGVAEWMYLIALVKVKEETAIDILNTLAEINKIDQKLWSQGKIIWCQSLVDNISDAYKKRTVSVPEKPTFSEFPHRKPDLNEVSGDGNPQIKLNKTKVNNKEREIDAPAQNPPEEKTDTEIATALQRINNEAFNFRLNGLSSEFLQCAEIWIKDDVAPDLIIKALAIGNDKASSTTGICPYARKVIQGWIQDGIKTLAQWEEKNKPEPAARGKSTSKFKPQNSANFEQRQYDDKFYDGMYDNVKNNSS